MNGLNQQEAEKRLEYYGSNTLPVKEAPTIWAILLQQVLNPLIFILPAAAVASVAIGEGADAVFILTVIALNNVSGPTKEHQAEKSAAGLQRLLKITAFLSLARLLFTVNVLGAWFPAGRAGRQATAAGRVRSRPAVPAVRLPHTGEPLRSPAPSLPAARS